MRHGIVSLFAIIGWALWMPPALAAAQQSTQTSNSSPAIIEDAQAVDIIRRADRIRAPAEPFRYALTLVEMKGDHEVARQSFDVAMRFYKAEAGQQCHQLWKLSINII